MDAMTTNEHCSCSMTACGGVAAFSAAAGDVVGGRTGIRVVAVAVGRGAPQVRRIGGREHISGIGCATAQHDTSSSNFFPFAFCFFLLGYNIEHVFAAKYWRRKGQMRGAVVAEVRRRCARWCGSFHGSVKER